MIIPCQFSICRYRKQSDKRIAVCSIHPTELATLQCLGCIKARISVSKSYHCSSRCFFDAWQHHRALHDRAANAVNENGTEDEELFGRLNNNTSVNTPLYSGSVNEKGSSEMWLEVGRSKTYTPAAEDIGQVLKFECLTVDAETRIPMGPASTIFTSRVIPAPTPTPRQMIPVGGADMMGHFDSDGRMASGSFTVLSYNILSDAYATSEIYGYCPSWALSWQYRRQNLLREIVGYHADILCLQEV